MLAAGIWAPTLGIFLAPLQHDLGWSQTQVYFGVTLAYLLAQLAAPLSGWIVDRGQVRRLMLGALLLQVAIGVSLVELRFPLLLADAHNAGAALLLLTVVAVNYFAWRRQYPTG